MFRAYLKSQQVVMPTIEGRITFVTPSNDADKPVSVGHLSVVVMMTSKSGKRPPFIFAILKIAFWAWFILTYIG